MTIDQAQKEENTAKKMQILKYKRQNMCEMLKNTPKPSKNTKKGVKYLKNAKTAQKNRKKEERLPHPGGGLDPHFPLEVIHLCGTCNQGTKTIFFASAEAK